MKRRKLKQDELALWRKVTDQAKPLHSPNKAETPPLEPPVAEGKRPEKLGPVPLKPFLSPKPKTTHDLAGPVEKAIADTPVRMDKKAFKDLKRGKLTPEARLDLHGMTLDRAHPALIRFILDAQARGLRLVLVITGKGKNRDDHGPIPVRHGVLRHQVPQWLGMPSLSQAVLQISQAHQKHGGGGAYYVYIRRDRARR